VHATNPPPRVSYGGTNGEVSWLRDSTRLPGFPVAIEWSAGHEGQFPVTVAGPRRFCTGFRVAPFVFVCTAALVYRLRLLAAREAGSV
jgi:hypothetical protein